MGKINIFFLYIYFTNLMEIYKKNIACLLYNNLLEQNIKNNNIKIICNLIKITKSTFYRWNN